MKFTLTIEMGNDAMQSYADIAGAIRAAIKGFDTYDPITEDSMDYGRIRDLNGNTVGRWEVSE